MKANMKSYLDEAKDQSGHVEDEENHDKRHQSLRQAKLLRS